MVGEARAGSGPVPGLSARIGRAYDVGAAAWTDGPAAAYAELARMLVGRVPTPLAGRCVLDLGAGTGVAGIAAVRVGAGRVVAADLAPAMLARCRPWLTPVTADAARLPFADGAFDVVLAAFSLSHVPGLPAALHECRRVAGVLVASAFAAGWTHPAKSAVDGVLARFGYEPPGWYAQFKRELESAAEDTGEMARMAVAAGFGEAGVHVVRVTTGLAAPAELASWRLGMAHVAAFVHPLDEATRRSLVKAATDAVAGCGPLDVDMAVLTAVA
jgi:ubiquinone/menaquinone biosynthesis C-methylase UbiE